MARRNNSRNPNAVTISKRNRELIESLTMPSKSLNMSVNILLERQLLKMLSIQNGCE